MAASFARSAPTRNPQYEAEKHPDYPDHDQWRIVASDVNWEDASLTCDNCGQRIESAYGEQQGGAE